MSCVCKCLILSLLRGSGVMNGKVEFYRCQGINNSYSSSPLIFLSLTMIFCLNSEKCQIG